eukprot:gnl/Spiro4/28543_TR14111_c0_g1_i1.p1 gnl/Spiro4/28543_TR14111_c0_g1~~gnl/Spiro4/28543_TR14111_c0_g1_i1.p1  ORF type:complete len:312 (+),score=39.02 gnl/Spiro4/28543_TR14111_c0_g1_i1:32-937(+)
MDPASPPSSTEPIPAPSRESSNVDEMEIRLRQLISNKQFFEAHQMYKVLNARFIKKNQFTEAQRLLVSGVLMMLSSHSAETPLLASASELCSLLFAVFLQANVALDQNVLAAITRIHDSFPPAASAEKHTFLTSALKWTQNAKSGGVPEGHPLVHNLLAQCCIGLQKHGQAQVHFLRGNQPELFAQVLTGWARRGYESEQDLFISRAILRYLCLGNLKDANTCFRRFCDVLPLDTPLINFTRFLLLAVERDAYPLFVTLTTRYQPSLQRDPQFQDLLHKVAHVFFHIAPPAAGILEQLGLA